MHMPVEMSSIGLHSQTEDGDAQQPRSDGRTADRRRKRYWGICPRASSGAWAMRSPERGQKCSRWMGDSFSPFLEACRVHYVAGATAGPVEDIHTMYSASHSSHKDEAASLDTVERIDQTPNR